MTAWETTTMGPLFVWLTGRYSGRTHLVNTANVTEFNTSDHEDETKVEFTSGKTLLVAESPSEIAEMIQGTWEPKEEPESPTPPAQFTQAPAGENESPVSQSESI